MRKRQYDESILDEVKDVLRVLQQNSPNPVALFAGKIGVDQRTVQRWIDGTRIPQVRHHTKIRELLKQYRTRATA